MTAFDVVKKNLGTNAFVSENPLITQASTTPTEVFGSNPQRLQMFIINLGSNACYLASNPNPSSTNGIILAAGGGFIEFDVNNDSIVATRPWYIVTASGTSDIYSFEVNAY